ncbi:ABC-F family ATP-binding cassette domain-containing protein [Nonlabens sp. Ci31]|jgi:ATP-binding cassette subfamily F protein uup|uniref:ABC-F family ATP-binding cassette domain-containing protein n=1 Tax=Nonlabens sp. Ci31 TaxID=2608253 RepID=UPI001462C636|nr:ABC-F family ATP-binding cassette domain-containing protein [Nonlabens sp. Ci31]QJP33012.1 ABC-F family ATP-binding cassette domain-containing protein [Nonlabens sp. Ci31]
MNYITVENVTRAFADKVLFKDLSIGINQGQKIGFVAKNGYGKSSLLNIITRAEEPDSGNVSYRTDLRMAFLSQEPNLNPDMTIEEVILGSDVPTMKIIADYEHSMANPDDADMMQKALDAMDAANAWDFETKYRQILSKLRLDDLTQKVGKLSGGQKKRIAMAMALLSDPQLLIMDEPTNHLDLEMIEWLEAYFKQEDYTILMVTHDRYFLDRVCNEIIELDQGQLYTYKGNYSYYVEKKQERLEVEQTNQEKAQQLFKKELTWMRRQPKARRTKSKSRIEDFNQIKEAASNRRKDHQVELEINMQRLGTKVVELHKISKSFGDTHLINDFSYNFLRGERLGIIGKNGTGKSTFLNMITGALVPDAGKVVIGETVKIGYYTQNGMETKPGQKVIDVVKQYGEYIPLNKGKIISASQLLERFLFDNKKKHDFVEKLSGGEKKRLYLCTVLIQNPNFLILDEPTNDLDIPTLNVLENFLMDFPGCIIVVSHDRYFMDKIVDHLFVFNQSGTITDFPGNYSDFRAYVGNTDLVLDKDTEEEAAAAVVPVPKAIAAPKSEPASGPTREQQKRLSRMENKIKQLEEQKKKLQDSFLNTDIHADQMTENSIQLEKTKAQQEEVEMEWLELSEQIAAN